MVVLGYGRFLMSEVPITIETCHARVKEVVGPSKGNGTKCPLLRNFQRNSNSSKVNHVGYKINQRSGERLKNALPLLHSGVVQDPPRKMAGMRINPDLLGDGTTKDMAKCSVRYMVQGYLAHKKTPTSRTLH